MPTYANIPRCNPPKWEDFECPNCKGSKLDEVSQGLIYNSINGFYDGYQDYGDQNFSDTRVIRYECFYCGEEILDGYSLELYNDLKAKGYIKGQPATEVEWEV